MNTFAPTQLPSVMRRLADIGRTVVAQMVPAIADSRFRISRWLFLRYMRLPPMAEEERSGSLRGSRLSHITPLFEVELSMASTRYHVTGIRTDYYVNYISNDE